MGSVRTFWVNYFLPYAPLTFVSAILLANLYTSLAKCLRVLLRTNWLWVRISFLSLITSDMTPALSKEVLNIQANFRVWIHSETLTWHDNKIQSLTASHACSSRDQINWFGNLMAWNEFSHMNSTTSHSGLSQDLLSA